MPRARFLSTYVDRRSSGAYSEKRKQTKRNCSQSNKIKADNNNDLHSNCVQSSIAIRAKPVHREVIDKLVSIAISTCLNLPFYQIYKLHRYGTANSVIYYQ